MRQVIMVRPYELEVVELPQPVPGPGETLVETRVCGICTLEQRVYRGIRNQYPFRAGHEVSGIVKEVNACSSIEPGDKVAVSLVPRCGSCAYCKAGHDNLCSYFTASRSTGELWGPGGLSDYMIVREQDAFPVSTKVTFDTAALVEPIACCLHSLRRANALAGKVLAVVGTGFFGLLHVGLANSLGLRTVALSLPNDPPIAKDIRSLPKHVYGMVADLATTRSVLENLDVPGVDICVCTRGGNAAFEAALLITRPGGTVVVFESMYGGQQLNVAFEKLRSRELTVTASLSHTRSDFAEAARLVSSGRLGIDALVLRAFPFNDIEAAMRYAVASPRGRTMVHFGG